MASAKLWRRFIRALEVEDHRGHEAQISFTESFLSNDDLLPVPVGKRTWAAWNFVSFWVADSFNINTWMIASSMIQLGLSWWQAWICVWIGYGITAPFLVLNARPGAVFHITFPVVARASFGLWGSLWCVLNRAAMACIWYGVQASIGGDCVLVMLRAMWPSVNNIPNSMPESSGTNTRDFMCFLLFWIISLPAIWLPIHKVYTAPVHSKGDRRPHSRYHVFHLVHRQSPWRGSDRAPTCANTRLPVGLGNRCQLYGMCEWHDHSYNQRSGFRVSFNEAVRRTLTTTDFTSSRFWCYLFCRYNCQLIVTSYLRGSRLVAR